MALEKIIRYTEKDIEDWLWENPDQIDWVDGWIERQLRLQDNSILDLLGYKKSNCGDWKYLVLVELKSNPLKHDDLFQIKNYEAQLERTVNNVGLDCLGIEMRLIGTDQRLSSQLLRDANHLDIRLHSIEIDQDGQLTLSGEWSFTKDYYQKQADNCNELIRGNRLDKLVEFLIPEMHPDLIDMCKRLVSEKKRSVSDES